MSASCDLRQIHMTLRLAQVRSEKRITTFYRNGALAKTHEISALPCLSSKRSMSRKITPSFCRPPSDRERSMRGRASGWWSQRPLCPTGSERRTAPPWSDLRKTSSARDVEAGDEGRRESEATDHCDTLSARILRDNEMDQELQHFCAAARGGHP